MAFAAPRALCRRLQLLAASLLLLLSAPRPASARRRGYVTSAVRNPHPGVLNIHLVPHTHDDAGWLKTVDQYYYGANSSIQVAGVQYILDTVVTSLLQNPDRKFVYAEIAFFSKWWDEQDDDIRAAVRKLVAEGRLSFVNGGYVQHDEATTHYVAMVDQTTRGHRWLARELHLEPPRVGWQIDPFGHSRTHSSMFASFAGMDALFFGRIDHKDLDLRKNNRELEMMWQAGMSYGSAGDCFAGAFYSGNYGPPPGFNWDHGQHDTPMQDDPKLCDYNVDGRLADFVQQVNKIASWHQGNDIMLTMGSDFQYMNANHWFRNLDSLIHHLNSHPTYGAKYNAFYSTPETYVAAKHSYNISWPVKKDDFFPYSDCNHCYWTGYFTSKAASKRYIRAATSYLQVARQIEVAAGMAEGDWVSGTDSLEEAVSLLQHHDGITGTAKKHVVNDYNRRIAAGWAEARQTVKSAIASLVRCGERPLHSVRRVSSSSRALRLASDRLRADDGTALPGRNTSGLGIEILGECPLQNVSICLHSVDRVSANGPGVEILLYNPLAWRRTVTVRVPIGDALSVAVTDMARNAVLSQVVPVTYETQQLQRQEADGGPGHAVQEVVFLADLEPLAFSFFAVRPTDAGDPGAAVPSEVTGFRGDEVSHDAREISNGELSLSFNEFSGTITKLKNMREGIETPLDHRFMWYRSSDGQEMEDPGQASGAYIFRPVDVHNVSQSGRVLTQIVEGPVVKEIRQSHASWAAVTHRLWKAQPFVESEWTVGPIPIDDGVGREVVSRWSSGLQSGNTFLTDTNGREMLERKLNHRDTWDLNVTEPVAGNYYPVTAAAAIQDSDTREELFVITDRAQAATSLGAGQLEFMVHRRTTKDDSRGVDEPIDETTCDCHDCSCPIRQGLTVRGTHLLSLRSAPRAASARRRLQQEANDPPLMMFTNGIMECAGGARSGALPLLEGVTSLPSNVHLLTMMQTKGGAVLLRLAHLFEAGEGGAMGEPACIDLQELLGNIAEVRDMSLTGVPLSKERATRRLWNQRQDTAAFQPAKCKQGLWVYSLKPMEIRTWEVYFQDDHPPTGRTSHGPLQA